MPRPSPPILRLVRIAWAALAAPPMGLWGTARGRQARALRAWSAIAARAVGLEIEPEGPEPPPAALVAANHVGYLDILALGAVVPGRFVAKAEIAGWPFLGALARWGGTVFLDRERPRDCVPWVDRLARVLEGGERVLLFPEAGVSSDGRTLGAFRPMLFEASMRSGAPVVPVALRYVYPDDPRVWAWIDEPSLWQHLRARVLPADRIRVRVLCGAPIDPRSVGDRKALAEAAREAVARLLAGDRPAVPPSALAPPTASVIHGFSTDD